MKDREGGALAFMGGPCNLMYAAGASVRDGLLVEFGTWAGGSMRCYAAGLNTTGHHGRAHGFDFFYASQYHKLRGTKWFEQAKQKGEKYDIMPIYYWQTQDLYPSVKAHRGNWQIESATRQALGDGTIIDVFADDETKIARQLVGDFAIVADRLRPGALILLADWLLMASEYGVSTPADADIVLFTFYALIIPKKLELIGAALPYAFFRVLEPFDAEYLRTSLAEWERISKSSTEGSRPEGEGKSCQHVQAKMQRTLFGPCTSSSCIGLPLGASAAMKVEGGKLHSASFAFRRGSGNKCRGKA